MAVYDATLFRIVRHLPRKTETLLQ